MNVRIDLDLAAEQILRRRDEWERRGISVGDLTWRELAEGWPRALKPSGQTSKTPIRSAYRCRREARGSVVLYQGGWADLLFWNGEDDELVDEAPGWPRWLDGLTIESSGALLDRFGGFFT